MVYHYLHLYSGVVHYILRLVRCASCYTARETSPNNSENNGQLPNNINAGTAMVLREIITIQKSEKLHSESVIVNIIKFLINGDHHRSFGQMINKVLIDEKVSYSFCWQNKTSR